MKQRNHIGILVLLAVALTGCQQIEEEFEQQTVDIPWKLTIRASRNGNGTRGLAIGDKEDAASTTKLQSIWKDGEQVYVYKDATLIGSLKATPDEKDAHYAILTGSVTTSEISAGRSPLL